MGEICQKTTQFTTDNDRKIKKVIPTKHTFRFQEFWGYVNRSF